MNAGFAEGIPPGRAAPPHVHRDGGAEGQRTR